MSGFPEGNAWYCDRCASYHIGPCVAEPSSIEKKLDRIIELLEHERKPNICNHHSYGVTAQGCVCNDCGYTWSNRRR